MMTTRLISCHAQFVSLGTVGVQTLLDSNSYIVNSATDFFRARNDKFGISECYLDEASKGRVEYRIFIHSLITVLCIFSPMSFAAPGLRWGQAE